MLTWKSNCGKLNSVTKMVTSTLKNKQYNDKPKKVVQDVMSATVNLNLHRSKIAIKRFWEDFKREFDSGSG